VRHSSYVTSATPLHPPAPAAAPEPAFDALARLAARVTGWPIAALNLFDGAQLAAKAVVGAQHRALAPLLALCGRVMQSGQALLLPDLRSDPLAAADEPLQAVASALGLRAYAAVPLHVGGQTVGTLCVLAGEAGSLPDTALQDLHDLAVTAAALSIDASGRRRAEDALAEQRARTRAADARMAAVLRAVPDLWFVLDDEGHYKHCSNPEHPALVKPYEEFRHSRLAEVLPPHLARQAHAAMQAARASGESQRFEYDLAVKGGAVGHYEGRMSPMPDGELLLLIRDLTDLHALANEVRDKQAAELASRSKSEFLSRMSHEMRTPLNAVIGFAQLMRLQGGARLDYADHVLQAGQHLLALIDDVLDLQQVEAGRMTLNVQALSPSALLANCVALLEPLARSRNVQQVVDNSAPQVPALAHGMRQVLADEQRLRQVLLNIGSNAIKYNRAGGKVRWSVESAAAGRLALVVEDTGPGMTPEQQVRLFQPFERLGRENSALEGSGLGLLIARRLAEEMGGTLVVHSRPGQGTRVVVALPVAPALQPPPPPPQKAPPLRLLYVEDNRLNALLFEETLKQHTDVQLRVAEDGAAALTMAADAWPDVLVLDANLPGATGYEVLQQLRALPGLADVPAFMCSADALPEDLQRAKAAGFRGYWTKPLELSRILSDLKALGAGLIRTR
jgi:signal transduction histidine kinase